MWKNTRNVSIKRVQCNEMQYTIRKLYSTERKGTQPSVRIERIVELSEPLTIIKDVSFSKSP